MAAARKAIWDDMTWKVPLDEMVARPPSHMMLLSLRAQAAAMIDVAELTVDDIADGLAAYETHRQAIIADDG
jgi:hypothetical protein